MSAALMLAVSNKLKASIRLANGQVKSFQFDQNIVKVGRDPGNDIYLSEDQKISRFHFELCLKDGKWLVENKSPKNFILQNGLPKDQFILAEGDEITAGETVFKFEFEKPSKAEAVNLSLVSADLGQAVAIKTQNPILQPTQPVKITTAPPRPAQPKIQAAPPKSIGNSDSGRIKFYGAILIIGLVAFYFLSEEQNKSNKATELRQQYDVSESINQSIEAVKEIESSKQTKGEDTLQFKVAQENYIKGFRDYRQGQYARAMQSFQAALSFYPSHELARKYWTLSKRKFDEKVQLLMIQGRNYYGKNNYRLCKSSFASVMIMMKDPTDLIYKEAKQYYDECSLRFEGRF